MFSKMINSSSPRLQEPINFNYIQTSLYESPHAYQNTYDQINEKESEIVDELIGISLGCLNRADMKTREALLGKFFFEIENEESRKEFLARRIKHSKLYLETCLDQISNNGSNINERCRGIVNGLSGDGGDIMSEKLERFKVKIVRVGDIVREEAE